MTGWDDRVPLLKRLKYRIFTTVSLALEVITETVVMTLILGETVGRKFIIRARMSFLSRLKLSVSKFNIIHNVSHNVYSYPSLQNAKPSFSYVRLVNRIHTSLFPHSPSSESSSGNGNRSSTGSIIRFTGPHKDAHPNFLKQPSILLMLAVNTQ